MLLLIILGVVFVFGLHAWHTSQYPTGFTRAELDDIERVSHRWRRPRSHGLLVIALLALIGFIYTLNYMASNGLIGH